MMLASLLKQKVKKGQHIRADNRIGVVVKVSENKIIIRFEDNGQFFVLG